MSRAATKQRSREQWRDVARACILNYGALQKLGELAPFLKQAAELRPGRLIEIGTCHGGTLYGLARAAHPQALIVSVDLPGARFSDPDGNSRTVPELERLLLPSQTGVFLRGNSHDPDTLAATVAALDGAHADLLFIDGDHTREGCRRDFDDYAPLVRPGGLVAFHDVLKHTVVKDSEVDRVWRELRPGYRHWEHIKPGIDVGMGEWGGIGVIEWNPDR